MSGYIKTFQFGKHEVTLETGIMARQATGSVVVRMGGTCVLVAVVGKSVESAEPRGFMPLTVQFMVKAYATGKIPGGFFKREGRPTEYETLVSRLIDRPIRPLFPKGYESDVQVTATVLAVNPDINPDIVAMIGTSCALALSGIPFQGPIGAARVGYINGEYVLNPERQQLAESELDLVVAGTKDAVLMVESEASGLSEEIMLGAVMFGHEQMQQVIGEIIEFAGNVGVEQWAWEASAEDADVAEKVATMFTSSLTEAYQIQDKIDRIAAIAVLKQQLQEAHAADEDDQVLQQAEKSFSALEKSIVRSRIIDGLPRIDGRDTKTVRPINIDVGILPHTHGSALFTRGETQALVVITLGTDRDAQIVEELDGERREHSMLHYNFPAYCVCEAGMVLGPKRREIGHGKLAKRALEAVVPSTDEFPYVKRVVSEIMESNGSSSMASVCGASLALMDAGVPIKAPVAGIAMGLIKAGDKFAVLTDILGDEDHLGDMDFKVAGTATGITALQMDIKIQGITREIMEQALQQAKDGRLHILGIMNQTIAQHRADVSEYAPGIITVKVHPDKIRDIIGKGGVNIRALTEETGTSIDISDDGTVKIAAVDRNSGLEAKRRIELMTADAEVGRTYLGKVVKIVDFGAFVNFLPGKDGLLHISQISNERVENVTDVLSEGQEIPVKVLEVDRQGKVRLSMKEAEALAEVKVVAAAE